MLKIALYVALMALGSASRAAASTPGAVEAELKVPHYAHFMLQASLDVKKLDTFSEKVLGEYEKKVVSEFEMERKIIQYELNKAAAERNERERRKVPDLRISTFNLETYYHKLPEQYGKDNPFKVYFDHVVIARERIGVIAVRCAGGK